MEAPNLGIPSPVFRVCVSNCLWALMSTAVSNFADSRNLLLSGHTREDFLQGYDDCSSMILYYCRTASCIQYYGKVPVTAGIVCQTQYPGTGRPVLFATPSPLLRLLKTVFCIVTDFYEARPSFVPAFLCPGLGSRLSVYNTVNIFIFRDLVPGYAYAHTFLRSRVPKYSGTACAGKYLDALRTAYGVLPKAPEVVSG
eukprot:30099-Rhodomonas_salina.1